MVKISNDTIIISFNTINLLNMFVVVAFIKTDAEGTAIRIPGSEWYLEALTYSNT
uniref:hypothetical protein n=1 Tax=Alistipes shahii TaxID=328814 RepID=UPI004025D2DE